MPHRQRAREATRLALVSLAVGLAVLALKAAAWATSGGSAALYADALETVVNVAAAAAALAAVRYAARPADENHPWGHAKAEYVSAVMEGSLVVVAATLILQEAYATAVAGRAGFDAVPATAFALSAAATALNAAWAAWLGRRAAALRSPALAADARHLWADVATSVGVVAGVALAAATGLWWLDPALAVATALAVLWSGWRLVRASLGGLMDEAVDAALLARIRATVRDSASGAIEAHDLRARRAGPTTFVEFHLVVPGQMTVQEAHHICDRLEEAIQAELAGASVTIHVEPQEKAKHHGVLVL